MDSARTGYGSERFEDGCSLTKKVRVETGFRGETKKRIFRVGLEVAYLSSYP